MLYLIKSGDYIKIGFSNDVVNRMKSYKTCNPDFEILDIQTGSEYDEKRWHDLLLIYKHRGEWFHFNQEILNLWNQQYGSNIHIETKEDKLKLKEDHLTDKETSLLYRENFILNNIKNLIDQQQPFYEYLVQQINKSNESEYIKTLKKKDELITEMSSVIKELTSILNINYKQIQLN